MSHQLYFERKHCKSCMFFWNNKCIGIFSRDPWGNACEMYVKRERGK